MANHKLQAISGARFQVTEPAIMLFNDDHCFLDSLEDPLLRFPQKISLSLSLSNTNHFSSLSLLRIFNRHRFKYSEERTTEQTRH